MIYQIAFTVRSGSTLLCDYLGANGLGHPREYFQYDATGVLAPGSLQTLGVAPDDILGYVRALLAHRSRNGVFGCKMSWHQKNALLDQAMRCNAAVRYVEDLFPDVRWLYIRRRDKIGQAISIWRAIRSGRWHSTDPVLRDERPPYDYFPIFGFYQSILAEDALWQDYFQRRALTPLLVEYEDLQDAPRETMAAVVRRLRNTDEAGADGHPLQLGTSLEKMRDDYSVKLRERFADDLHHIGAPSHWESRRDQARRWQEFFDRELWGRPPGATE
jgi:LPS sulfotransferase NodH